MANAVRISGAKNPVNQVPFEVELDDGTVLEFTVPKIEYIPEDVMDVWEPWVEEWEAKAKSTAKAAAAERRKLRTYDPMLKLLELLLPEDVYAKVAAQARGVLIEMDQRWHAASRGEMGESGASGRS